MTVSIQVNRRVATVESTMKKLGDQVVKMLHMYIVAKLGRHNKQNKRKGADQKNQIIMEADHVKMTSNIIKNSSDNASSACFMFKCMFCDEETPLLNAFHIKGCNDIFCAPCIVKFVVSKLQDDITSIMCPQPYCTAKVLLDLDYCRRILPTDVADRWEKALSENNKNTSDKYLNCPYKACAARLNLVELQDNMDTKKKGQLLPPGFFSGFYMNKYLCTSCNREFCIRCRVPCHSEFDCLMYQRIKVNGGGEDQMVLYLAEKKKWKQCPCCNYYVIKEDSSCNINDVSCWCGYDFCYKCLRSSRDHDIKCT